MLLKISPKTISVAGLIGVELLLLQNKTLGATLVDPQSKCENSPGTNYICYEETIINNTGKIANDLKIGFLPKISFPSLLRGVVIAEFKGIQKKPINDTFGGGDYTWTTNNFFTVPPNQSVRTQWFSTNNDSSTERISFIQWTFNGNPITPTTTPEPSAFLGFIGISLLGLSLKAKK